MVSKKTSSSKAPDNAAFDFEASLAQLEDLVTRMEDGEMSLDESLKAFEEGVRLTRLCQETLVAAQQKVQLLMEQQGKVTLHDMPDVDVDSNDDDEE